MSVATHYVDVILPLPLPGYFSYSIPEALVNLIKPGIRIEVPFGTRKIYAGIVLKIHSERPAYKRIKTVISVIDTEPIVSEVMLNFWLWIGEYYACSPGEVMNVALPAGLRLSSETTLIFNDSDEVTIKNLSDEAYLLYEALIIRKTLSYEQASSILEGKGVRIAISELLNEKAIVIKEELAERYTPRKVSFVKLAKPYNTEKDALQQAFDLVKNSELQTDALLALLQISKSNPVRQTKLYVRPSINSAVIKALEKKGIVEVFEDIVSRLSLFEGALSEHKALSADQQLSFDQIMANFKSHQTVLLKGVTGSGKTHIYAALMEHFLANEKGQVLYLVPEIALTIQLISRLEKYFGNQIGVYHSRVNQAERTELWKKASSDLRIILAPRSGLFLPFFNLKLIIIDEEHDPSYKQTEQNPRYHGRDAAIYLAHKTGAKVLIGSATPSLESYFNAKTSKYGFVELNERYLGIEMPLISTANTRKKDERVYSEGALTHDLEKAIEKAISGDEQVILFRNRRGFAPVLKCTKCDWFAECDQCDVPMTYHKYTNTVRCHYCSYTSPVIVECPACASNALQLKGFGTQKLEEYISIRFPDVTTDRLDFDTAKTKSQFQRVIQDFEDGKTKILIGTQMITKGLDFDNVALVGVLNADQMLFYPSFRSHERAFQTLLQVSGRAGRKNKQGKVIIQTSMPETAFFQMLLANDIDNFYETELIERKGHRYPPYCRIIIIEIKHPIADAAFNLANAFVRNLEKSKQIIVTGPSQPQISRVRNYFIQQIMIRLPHNSKLQLAIKQHLLKMKSHFLNEKQYRKARIVLDVDPA